MAASIRDLNDEALLRSFGMMVRRDGEHMADLLRHMAEIDRHELWARLGHSSMFDFCVSRWHMSEAEAGNRIGACRAARRFPVIFDLVARREIHLTGINRLKAHLSEDNHRQVLAEAKHRTIAQIERAPPGTANVASSPPARTE